MPRGVDLKKNFHRKRTEESKRAFKKETYNCSRFYKKERKKFYANLDPWNITDTKRF